MSSSDEGEVGYQKPPREHRFTRDNQPRRKKRNAPRGHGHNLLEVLLRALDEDALINTNGKPKKVKVREILVDRLVKQAVLGTFNENLKLAKFVQSYGELDPDKMRRDIEEEYAHYLQKEQRRYTELFELAGASVALSRNYHAACKLITGTFVGAKSKCSCGAYEEDEEVSQLILKWSSDDGAEVIGAERTEPFMDGASGWAPNPAAKSFGGADAGSLGTTDSGLNGSKPQQSSPEDDLSAGMIGND